MWISPVKISAEDLTQSRRIAGSVITIRFNVFRLYDVPAGVIVLLSVFYGSISVLAVGGNSLVIWIVLTSRRMQNVTNCFIANLALADIVIALFAIPFQFQAALLQRWILPHFLCPFCPFVQVLTVNVSIFTLTAIAIDRQRAILNPFRVRLSKLRAKFIIAAIWIISAILATPIFVALRVVELNDTDSAGREYTKPFCNNVNLSNDGLRVYRWILVFLQYLTPMCVISFVYTRIALKLWGTKAPGNAENTRDAALMKNKKKVIKMLVIVVILFDICWLPWQIYNFSQEVFSEINEYRYINIIYFVCDWLAMSNSCYNPFIYGIYNEKFKREFQLRFPFHGRNWSPPADDNVEDKNLSVHTRATSLRTNYEWRRSYSSRHGNAVISNTAVNNAGAFYRGIAVRHPSAHHRNNNSTNGVQTELYVFPERTHQPTPKSVNELGL
ncbi:Leucokinin receptor [Carabus blaptoides fortunei]